MEIEIVNCKTKEDIQRLVDDSSITWEGLSADEESLSAMFAWVSKHTQVKRARVFVTSGELMNESYSLTGHNAYPQDLSIASVMSEDLENMAALAIPRLGCGGRWMDDIVDNHLRREQEK